MLTNVVAFVGNRPTSAKGPLKTKIAIAMCFDNQIGHIKVQMSSKSHQESSLGLAEISVSNYNQAPAARHRVTP